MVIDSRQIINFLINITFWYLWYLRQTLMLGYVQNCIIFCFSNISPGIPAPKTQKNDLCTILLANDLIFYFCSFRCRNYMFTYHFLQSVVLRMPELFDFFRLTRHFTHKSAKKSLFIFQTDTGTVRKRQSQPVHSLLLAGTAAAMNLEETQMPTTAINKSQLANFCLCYERMHWGRNTIKNNKNKSFYLLLLNEVYKQ